MTIDQPTIRPERAGDEAAIAAVIAAAFGRDDEAKLVARLREQHALAISLVALVGDAIAGHAGISPVTVEGQGGAGRWLGLAPLAVHPDRQRQTIGRQLVTAALDLAAAEGAAAVFVLGRPSYYADLGFEEASPLGWRCVYEVPSAAFRVRRLGDAPPPGIVRYHATFDEI